MAKLKWGLGLGAIVGLAGCATFGGNVKGNFRCEAPAGMCAPTSKIDDQALALISGGSPTPPASTMPAAGMRPANGAAANHSSHALKIVLPARQDRYGHWREPTIVYAELEDDGPVDLTGGEQTSRPPQRLSLAELAAGAPELPTPAAPAAAPSPRPQTREEIADLVKQRLQATSGSAKTGVAPAPATREGDSKPVATGASIAAPSFPAGDAPRGK